MDARKTDLLRKLDAKNPTLGPDVLRGQALAVGLSVDDLVLLGCGMREAPDNSPKYKAAVAAVEASIPGAWKALAPAWYFSHTCGRSYRTEGEMSKCPCIPRIQDHEPAEASPLYAEHKKPIADPLTGVTPAPTKKMATPAAS